MGTQRASSTPARQCTRSALPNAAGKMKCPRRANSHLPPAPSTHAFLSLQMALGDNVCRVSQRGGSRCHECEGWGEGPRVWSGWAQSLSRQQTLEGSRVPPPQAAESDRPARAGACLSAPPGGRAWVSGQQTLAHDCGAGISHFVLSSVCGAHLAGHRNLFLVCTQGPSAKREALIYPCES